MRFKLDENLDLGTVAFLGRAGHDVATVRAERIAGSEDPALFDISVSEGRTLITLDKDFLDTIRYPLVQTPGRIVLRPPKPLVSMIRALASRLPELLALHEPVGSLWVLTPGRFRVYRPAAED